MPCVVLAHGFSGTMDRLVPHATTFASNGIAALVFDYRTFGESGGEPRQVVDITGQQDDIRAAVAWLRDRDDIDAERIALWGNSLGGAHVISVAATDPRIAAVVAQIPFNGFPRTVEGRSTTAALRLFMAIVWDALRLVCIAIDDHETPEALTSQLAQQAPRGTLRDRTLADQAAFLRQMVSLPRQQR